MSILNIFDLVIGVEVLICMFLAWQNYRLSKAKSILWLFVGVSFGLVTRTGLFLSWPMITSKITAFIFWGLWIIALWYLLQLLRAFTNRANGGLWNTIKKWIGLK